MNALTPRSLLRRPRIKVELTPHELYRLITALEQDAMEAIANDRLRAV